MIVLFVIYIFPLLHSKLSTSLYTAFSCICSSSSSFIIIIFYNFTYICMLSAVMCINFLFFFFFLFFYIFFYISVFWVMLLGAERIRIESNRNWNRTENIKIGVDFLQFISISNVDSISVFGLLCVYMFVFVYVHFMRSFFERDYYYCICYFFSSTAFCLMWYGKKKLHPIVISESCAFPAGKTWAPKITTIRTEKLFSMFNVHLMLKYKTYKKNSSEHRKPLFPQ